MAISQRLADILHSIVDHTPWREEAPRVEAHTAIQSEVETPDMPDLGGGDE